MRRLRNLLLVALGAIALYLPLAQAQIVQYAVNAIVATTCSSSNWVRVISVTGAATCSQPVAADVTGAVPNTITISVSGTGLAGGGDLSANRTITITPATVVGATIGQVAITAAQTVDLTNITLVDFNCGSACSITTWANVVYGRVYTFCFSTSNTTITRANAYMIAGTDLNPIVASAVSCSLFLGQSATTIRQLTVVQNSS